MDFCQRTVARTTLLAALIVLGVFAFASVSSTDTVAAPITVAEFDFDDDFGDPDPQGWRPLALYGNEDAYFHVEDFSGAGHTITALSGSASMWCGLTAEDPRACHWNDAPGYGNNWRQNLSSIEFAVQGDVTLAFLMNASVEEGYDYVFVQYLDLAGNWTNLDTYNCGFFGNCTSLSKSYVIPAAAHNGTLRFRFFLTSDGAISDEGPWGAGKHIAFVVDDLSVSDPTGMVDFQGFETEAINDSATADSNWYAEPNTDALSSGSLESGTSLVQESPTLNNTNMWAFLGGSTTNFSCAGFPAQATTPWTRSMVRSPRIDLLHDPDGHLIVGAVDSVRLSFDVYRDIPTSQPKYYYMHVLYYGSCLLNRTFTTHVGDQKDWYRHTVILTPPAGTTEIVVELGVNYTQISSSLCNSHAPLFDNVTVERFGGVVTAAPSSERLTRASLQQNYPNPFNPLTVIEYTVPTNGERVRLQIFDASGRIVRTLVNEPQPSGPASVSWDGTGANGRTLASGVYFYRLSVGQEQVSRKMVLLK